jgi:hypothetical protein
MFIHWAFGSFVLTDADHCIPDANDANYEHENHVDTIYNPNAVGREFNHFVCPKIEKVKVEERSETGHRPLSLPWYVERTQNLKRPPAWLVPQRPHINLFSLLVYFPFHFIFKGNIIKANSSIHLYPCRCNGYIRYSQHVEAIVESKKEVSTMWKRNKILSGDNKLEHIWENAGKFGNYVSDKVIAQFIFHTQSTPYQLSTHSLPIEIFWFKGMFCL